MVGLFSVFTELCVFLYLPRLKTVLCILHSQIDPERIPDGLMLLSRELFCWAESIYQIFGKPARKVPFRKALTLRLPLSQD